MVGPIEYQLVGGSTDGYPMCKPGCVYEDISNPGEPFCFEAGGDLEVKCLGRYLKIWINQGLHWKLSPTVAKLSWFWHHFRSFWVSSLQNDNFCFGTIALSCLEQKQHFVWKTFRFTNLSTWRKCPFYIFALAYNVLFVQIQQIKRASTKIILWNKTFQ